MSKIITKWIADDAVDKTKVNADVAGDGIAQAAGGELDVKPDTTGGANVGAAIVVDPTNGVGIGVDDTTLEDDGAQKLRVKAGGIGANEIDETENYTWTGTHDFTGGDTNVSTPTNDNDAASKAYVDALANGFHPKGVVECLADSDLALTGDPGTVDTYDIQDGDVILLEGQSDPKENGIWVVDYGGPWARVSTLTTGDSAAGAMVWVDKGATYGDQQWVCITDRPNDVVGTNNLTFQVASQSSGASAGTGLTKTANIISVGTNGVTGNVNGINRTAGDIAAATDGVTTEVASNVIQVKDLGISTAKIAADAVDKTKINADVAGEGIAQAAGGELDLDINGLTNTETTPADADLLAIYEQDDARVEKITWGNLKAALPSGENIFQEMHTITGGEDTAGYFTLSNSPVNVRSLRVFACRGIIQINKDALDGTGLTPDFQLLSANQLHFNNNGAGTGLSGDLATGDTVIALYEY